MADVIKSQIPLGRPKVTNIIILNKEIEMIHRLFLVSSQFNKSLGIIHK